MASRDLITPPLLAELTPLLIRGAAEPSFRRVFVDDRYEIHAVCYPNGLLTALVHYKSEQLKIMTRLGTLGPLEGPPADAWVRAATQLLGEGGRGPFHWVLSAKLECGVLLTLHDRAALKLAGVPVPKSAGRYRDLFQNQ